MIQTDDWFWLGDSDEDDEGSDIGELDMSMTIEESSTEPGSTLEDDRFMQFLSNNKHFFSQYFPYRMLYQIEVFLLFYFSQVSGLWQCNRIHQRALLLPGWKICCITFPQRVCELSSVSNQFPVFGCLMCKEDFCIDSRLLFTLPITN